MKGKKVQQHNSMNKQIKKNNINSYKNNNKEISPHLNVLQFDLKDKNNVGNNNFTKKTKNIRNLSQKPINKTNNINIQNNNYYFNNINNNFIVKNSYPLNNRINNNINNRIIKNSQKPLKPININNNINKGNQNNQKKPKNILYNGNKKNDNIKIKLDQKGVFIAEEDDRRTKAKNEEKRGGFVL